jgi:hypothetical protein
MLLNEGFLDEERSVKIGFESMEARSLNTFRPEDSNSFGFQSGLKKALSVASNMR